MTRDPFSVLGVSSSATEDEIKSAYRKLAKKYHPDLNPGDKVAEEKMKEVNEAYAQALQIKKNGGTWTGNAQQGGYGSSGGYGYSGGYGRSQGGYGGYSGGYGGSSYGGNGYQQQGNPFDFGGFGFNPFEDFFGGTQSRSSTGFQNKRYASPELETIRNHVLAKRFNEALTLLNRITRHDADWHALYAQADLGMGNRISALEHARMAAQMAPNDTDYQNLLAEVESGRTQYQRTRQSGGYDFKSAICSNPFLSCCAINVVLNCCLGRYWLCC